MIVIPFRPPLCCVDECRRRSEELRHIVHDAVLRAEEAEALEVVHLLLDGRLQEQGMGARGRFSSLLLGSYLNYTLSGWTTPIDGAQLSCRCPSGQSDKHAVCCLLSLHLVLLRV